MKYLAVVSLFSEFEKSFFFSKVFLTFLLTAAVVINNKTFYEKDVEMFENDPSETQGERSHMNEDENMLAAVVESNIIFLFF